MTFGKASWTKHLLPGYFINDDGDAHRLRCNTLVNENMFWLEYIPHSTHLSILSRAYTHPLTHWICKHFHIEMWQTFTQHQGFGGICDNPCVICMWMCGCFLAPTCLLCFLSFCVYVCVCCVFHFHFRRQYQSYLKTSCVLVMKLLGSFVLYLRWRREQRTKYTNSLIEVHIPNGNKDKTKERKREREGFNYIKWIPIL